MGVLRRLPFLVTLIRPSVQVEGPNVGLKNYASPALTKNVQCQFQLAAEESTQEAAGREEPMGATMFTLDADIMVDDRVTLPAEFGPQASEKFLVVSVERRHGIRGDYSHTESTLVKETRA